MTYKPFPATQLRSGMQSKNNFVENPMLIATVNICQSYGQRHTPPFLTHSVQMYKNKNKYSGNITSKNNPQNGTPEQP